MRRMWRRTALALVSLALLLGAGPGEARAAGDEEACTSYCGKRAAERCEDIESFKCLWYMAGCLAGCNLARL